MYFDSKGLRFQFMQSSANSAVSLKIYYLHCSKMKSYQKELNERAEKSKKFSKSDSILRKNLFRKCNASALKFFWLVLSLSFSHVIPIMFPLKCDAMHDLIPKNVAGKGKTQ